MGNQSDFKFTLDAIVNLKPGDISGIQKALDKLKIKPSAVKGAQRSAVQTGVGALEGQMKAVAKVISAGAKAGSSKQLDASAKGIQKVVAALVDASNQLGAKSSKDIQTTAKNVQKLVAALQALPQSMKSASDSITGLGKAAKGVAVKTPKEAKSTPSTGAGKPSAASSEVRKGAVALNTSFKNLKTTVDQASKIISTLGKTTEALISEFAKSKIAAGAPSRGSSTGPSTNEQADRVDSARARDAGVAYPIRTGIAPGSFADISNTSERIQKAGGPNKPAASVSLAELEQIADLNNQVVREASSLTTNEMSAPLETLRKAFGKYTELPDAVEKYAKAVQQGHKGAKANLETTAKSVKKEAEAMLGPKEAQTVARAMQGIRRASDAGLARHLVNLQEEQRAVIRQKGKEGASEVDIAAEVAKLQDRIRAVLNQIRKSVLTQSDIAKKNNVFTGPGGVEIPGVDALVDRSNLRQRNDAEEVNLKNLKTVVRGSDEEFKALRKETGLSDKTSRMEAGILLVTRDLKDNHQALRILAGAVTDLQNSIIPVTAAGKLVSQKITSELNSSLGRVIRKKPLDRIGVKQQADITAAQLQSEVGTRAPSAAAGAIGAAFKGGPGADDKKLLAADKAAKQILRSLDQNTTSIKEFNKELELTLAGFKRLNSQGIIDDVELKSVVSLLKAAQKEQQRFGTGVGRAKPAAIFGKRAFAETSRSAIEIVQKFQDIRNPIETSKKIFSLMRGDAQQVRESFNQVLRDLERATAAKIPGLDPDNARAVLGIVKTINKDLQNGVVPKNISRADGFKEAARQARERVAKSPRQDLEFNVRIPGAVAGELDTLAVKVDKTSAAYGRLNITAKKTNTTLADRNSVQTALRRVVLWGSASGLIYGALGTLRNAIGVVTEVETGVIKVGKVMKESIANFEQFRQKILQTAGDLTGTFGVSIQEVLDTFFIFAQQGLEFPDVAEATRVSALAANVTTMRDAADASEALTAAFRQFGFEVSDSESILDSWNEVANRTAVTESVLADATKKAGTAAKNAGVTFHEFNGLVSAVGAATRQTGKEIGTSLRFIFQRITRPTAASALRQVGVDVNNAAGNFRGFMPIVNDLSRVWGELNQSQRLGIAQAAAGIRQYNSFLVVMDQFGAATEAAGISSESQGSAMRENQEVMKSAVKQYAQLKEEVKKTAIGIGNTLLPAVKVIVGALKSMVEVFNAIPNSLRAVTGLFGIMGVSALAMGQKLDFLLSGLSTLPAQGGALKGLASGIGSALAGIGAGVPINILQKTDPVKAFKAEADAIRRASIQVSDFSGGGLSSLKKADLGSDALTILGDTAGTASKKLSKFALAVRGVNATTGAAVLSVSDMNSVFAKVGLTLARMGQSTAGFFTAGLGSISRWRQNVKEATDASAKGMAKYTTATGAAAVASKGFLVSLLPLAGIAAAIGIAYYGISKGYKAVTESGADVVTSLKSQTAALEVQLNKARDYSREIENLSKATDDYNKNANLSQEDVTIQRGRGSFIPQFSRSLEIADKQKRVVERLGASAADAVIGFDKLGRAVLRSNSSLKAYTNSNVEAIATQVASVKATAAAALAAELVGDSWWRSARQIDTFNAASERVTNLLTDYSGVAGGLPLLDDKFRTENMDRFRKRVGEATSELRKQRAAIVTTGTELIGLIESFPKETPIEFFQDLAFDDDKKKTIDAVRELGKIKLEGTDFKGTIDDADALNYLYLKATTKLKELGIVGEETISKLRGKKIDPISVSLGNIDSVTQDFKDRSRDFEGAIAAFKLPGESKLRQASIILGEDGQLVVRRLGENKKIIEQSMGELLGSLGVDDIKVIAPKQIATIIGERIEKAKKIATGAGAGITFTGEVNLGARLNLDLTAQQRVAKDLPELYQLASKAQRQYNAELKDFEEAAKKAENASGLMTRSLDKAASKLNIATFFLRIATEIEQLSIQSEKAADALSKLRVEKSVDAFISSFGVGASKGIVESRQFTSSPVESQLNSSQKFNRDFGSVIDNLSVEQANLKKQRDRAVSAQNLADDFPKIISAFDASLGRTGTPKDLEFFLKNLEKSLDPKEAISNAATGKGLSLDQARNDYLKSTKEATKSVDEHLVQGFNALGADIKQGDKSKASRESLSKGIASAINRNLGSSLKKEDKTVVSKEEVKQRKEIIAVQSKTSDSLSKRIRDDIDKAIAGRKTFSPDEIVRTITAAAIKENEEKIASANENVSQRRAEAGTASPIASIRPAIGYIKEKTEGLFGLDRQKSLNDAVSAAEASRDKLVLLQKGLKASVEAGLPGIVEATRKYAREMADNTPDKQTKREGNLAKSRENILETAERLKPNFSGLGLASLAAQKSLVSMGQQALSSAFEFSKVPNELSKVINDLRRLDSQKLLDSITAPLAGALKGTTVFSPDLGKADIDLSPIERLNKRFNDTFRSIDEGQKTVLPRLRKALDEVNKVILIDEERLAEVRTDTSAAGVEASKLIETSLSKEKDVKNGLIRITDGYRSSLSKLTESMGDVARLETARKSIEDIVSSLDKASALSYDKSSLDVALGRSPFSKLPAELGLPKNQDKFEREEYKLKKRLSDELLSHEERTKVQQQLKVLEFNKKETKIGQKQALENQKLSREVSAGEGTLDKLYGLQERGVAPERIGGLIETLKSELSRAGETSGGFGGNEEFFKGLPSLRGIGDELAKIQQEVKVNDLQKHRDVVMKPTEAKLTEVNETLKGMKASQESFLKTQKEAKAIKDKAREDKVVGDKTDSGSDAASSPLNAALNNYSEHLTSLNTSIPSLSKEINILRTDAISKLIAALNSSTPAAKKGATTDTASDTEKTTNKVHGGFISGPAGIDNVPAKLTAGEFVVPKRSADVLRSNFGPEVFSAIQSGDVSKFALGGPVKEDDVYAGINKKGRLVLSNTRDSSLFDAARPNTKVNTLQDAGRDKDSAAFTSRYYDIEGAEVLARKEHRQYKEARKQGFSSLSDYEVSKSPEDYKPLGEQFFGPPSPGSWDYGELVRSHKDAEEAERTAFFKSLSAPVANKQPKRQDRQVEKESLIAGNSILNSQLLQASSLSESLNFWAAERTSSPKAEALHRQEIKNRISKLNKIKRSLFVGEDDATLSFLGKDYSVSKELAESARSKINHIISGFEKKRAAKEDFGRNPILNTLRNGTLFGPKVEGTAGEYSEAVQSMAGNIGLGVTSSVSGIIDKFSQIQDQPNATERTVEESALLLRSAIISPVTGLYHAAKAGLDTAQNADFGSRQGRVDFMSGTISSIIGGTSAAAAINPALSGIASLGRAGLKTAGRFARGRVAPSYSSAAGKLNGYGNAKKSFGQRLSDLPENLRESAAGRFGSRVKTRATNLKERVLETARSRIRKPAGAEPVASGGLDTPLVSTKDIAERYMATARVRSALEASSSSQKLLPPHLKPVETARRFGSGRFSTSEILKRKVSSVLKTDIGAPTKELFGKVAEPVSAFGSRVAKTARERLLAFELNRAQPIASRISSARPRGSAVGAPSETGATFQSLVKDSSARRSAILGSDAAKKVNQDAFRKAAGSEGDFLQLIKERGIDVSDIEAGIKNDLARQPAIRASEAAQKVTQRAFRAAAGSEDDFLQFISKRGIDTDDIIKLRTKKIEKDFEFKTIPKSNSGTQPGLSLVPERTTPGLSLVPERTAPGLSLVPEGTGTRSVVHDAIGQTGTKSVVNRPLTVSERTVSQVPKNTGKIESLTTASPETGSFEALSKSFTSPADLEAFLLSTKDTVGTLEAQTLNLAELPLKLNRDLARQLVDLDFASPAVKSLALGKPTPRAFTPRKLGAKPAPGSDAATVSQSALNPSNSQAIQFGKTHPSARNLPFADTALKAPARHVVSNSTKAEIADTLGKLHSAGYKVKRVGDLVKISQGGEIIAEVPMGTSATGLGNSPLLEKLRAVSGLTKGATPSAAKGLSTKARFDVASTLSKLDSAGYSTKRVGDSVKILKDGKTIAEVPGGSSSKEAASSALLKKLRDVSGFAEGGTIRGPGGPTSDSVPILASAGEYVINAKSAKSLGLARLDYLNKMGDMPKYRNGGPIGNVSSSASQGVSVDTDAIAAAIISAMGSAGDDIASKIAETEVTLIAPEVSELTLQAPSAGDLTLKAPEFPELKLQAPDISELKLQAPDLADLRLQAPDPAELKLQAPDLADLKLQAPDTADLTLQPPIDFDLTLKLPADLDLTIKAPTDLDLTLKAPSPSDLTLTVPEIKVATGDIGGPGAARLNAIEGSVDVIKEQITGVKTTVEKIKPGANLEEINQTIDARLNELKGVSDTDINERFSNVVQELKGDIDTRISNQLSVVNNEVLRVEATARQALSSATDALSRTM